MCENCRNNCDCHKEIQKDDLQKKILREFIDEVGLGYAIYDNKDLDNVLQKLNNVEKYF